MKIVLAGATGFIGNSLVPALRKQGHSLILLTRSQQSVREKTDAQQRYVAWDAMHTGHWAAEVDGADAVINLAGESIAAGRWTSSKKRRLTGSRINATRAIVGAIAAARNRPEVLINASAVGYYGSVPEGEVTEMTPKGTGFLADLSEQWEEEARTAEVHGIRVAMMRIGVVLGKGGGALEKMIPPFRFFIGGPLGSGKQWFPWIHVEDVSGAIVHTLTHPSLSGPVNLAAPETVTMKQFCRTLGDALGRPSWAPVPAFALRILLGEMSDMLLTGQMVIPAKLAGSGYSFRYPQLSEALKSIVRG